MENMKERPLYEVPDEIFVRFYPLDQLEKYATRHNIGRGDIKVFMINAGKARGVVFIKELDEDSDDESRVRRIVKTSIPIGLEELTCTEVIECQLCNINY